MQRTTKIAIIASTPIAILVWVIIGYFAFVAIGQPVRGMQDVAPATVVKQTPPAADELLKLVNEERAKVGVAPLTMRVELNQSAQIKADEVLKTGVFSHVDANGKHGYVYAYDALPDECKLPSENIRRNLPTDNTAEAAIAGLKSSPAHYKAMINPEYKITGLGISDTIIVEHFC